MVLLDTSSKKVVAAGEGSGKSWLAGYEGIAHLQYDLLRNGYSIDGLPTSRLYWVIGQDYQDAYQDFRMMADFALQLGLIGHRNDIHIRDEGRDKCSFTTTDGQFVETISGLDPTSVGRLEPDGIIGAEASRWSSELWTRSFGRIERTYLTGGWALYTGSFESSYGPFADYVALGTGPNEVDMKSFRIPSWSNRHKYPGGRDDPGIKRQEALLSHTKFMERFGGEPAPPSNAVFPEFSGRIHINSHIDYVDNFPTYIFIDPGQYVCSILFVQMVDQEVHVVDEMYVRDWSHRDVIRECFLRDGWKHVMSTTGEAVMDAAGRQHNQQSSAEEIWESETGLSIITNVLKAEAVIEKVRAALGTNPITGRARLHIHPRCLGLISELGGGPSPLEGGGTWVRGKSGKPESKNNHACTALGYGLIGVYGANMPEERLVMEFEDFTAPSYLRWKIE